MSNSYDGKGRPELIEDISTPRGMGYDVDQTHVKRQAIGRLQQQYLMNRSDFVRADDLYGHISGSHYLANLSDITHIPPLSTIDLGSDNGNLLASLRKYRLVLSGFLSMAFIRFREKTETVRLGLRPRIMQARTGFAAFWLAVLASLRGLNVTWLPKRYTVDRGQIADLRTKPFLLLKTAAPIGLILIAISWYMFSYFSLHDGRNRIKHGHQGTAQATQALNVSSSGKASSGSSKSSSGQTPRGSQASPSSSSGANTQAANNGSGGIYNGSYTTLGSAASTLQGVTGGGMGAGSFTGGGGTAAGSGTSSGPVPSTTLPSTSSLPLPVSTPGLPYTTTIPPVSSSAGGKNLISTTGTGITLN